MNPHFRLCTLLIFTIAMLLTGCAAQAVDTSPSATTPMPAAAATTEMPLPADTSAATETAAVMPTETVPTTPATEESAVGEPLVFSFSPGESKARYRVREQLVNLELPNDAVGETDQVSGSVTILPDGSIDAAASRFEVDLASLASDQSRRDNFLRSNVLQTSQFPKAVFVPKSISGLSWPLPESGEVKFQLSGDLTIRDFTKEVTWDVTGTLQDGVGMGQAVTSFTFADFNLIQPRVPVVLSIVDLITLEVDGTIRSGGQ